MLDCLNNTINVGDKIVYPNRHGSHMWLCNGTVSAIKGDALKVTREMRSWDGTVTQKLVTVRKMAHVAVVKPVGEVHVVEAKIEAVAPKTEVLSALGVPIKVGDRGIVLKWDGNKISAGKLLPGMAQHCNKPLTVEHKVGTDLIQLNCGEYYLFPASQFVHLDSKMTGDPTKPLTHHDKLAWITALLSGEFKQGNKALCENGKHCCLGVAAEIAGFEQEERGNKTLYKVKGKFCNYYLGHWNCNGDGENVFGLTHTGNSDKMPRSKSGLQYSLASLNDDGLTFSQIADIIEYFL